MLFVRILLTCAAMAAPLHAAFAGAWLQPEGKGQFIMQAAYYSSDEFFDRNGQLQLQARFRKYELQPYVEYGLTRDWTIGATGYLQHVSQGGGSNNGIADPEFFARTQLWGDDYNHLSIQPLIKLRSEFESDGNPRGGSRSTDAELSLLYGRSGLDRLGIGALGWNLFGPNDYIDTRVGYRYRGNRLHDQWKTDAALGIQLAPNWTAVTAMRGIFATKIPAGGAFSENGDQDYDLAKVEAGLNYRYSDTKTFGVTAFNHVYGRQTGSGSGVILSYMQGF